MPRAHCPWHCVAATTGGETTPAQVREDPMGRTGRFWFAVAAITIVIAGCSKTEGTKPPSSERPGDARAPSARAGRVRT